MFGASGDSKNAADLFTIPLKDPEHKAELLFSAAGMDFDPEVSPDGKWLAYHSNISGEFQVYVRPFPNVQDGRWQISTTAVPARRGQKWTRTLLSRPRRSADVRSHSAGARRNICRGPAGQDPEYESTMPGVSVWGSTFVPMMFQRRPTVPDDQGIGDRFHGTAQEVNLVGAELGRGAEGAAAQPIAHSFNSTIVAPPPPWFSGAA